MDKHMIILSPWTPPHPIEFWVQLRRLSAYMYSEALSLCLWNILPHCVQAQIRVWENEPDKYFCLHLQINILNPLRRIMKICVVNEDQFFTVLLYERLPRICFNCGKIDHYRDDYC